ncbi:MAG: hypothetical protein AB7O65_05320 [Candidatus Korobacteraceae bacterium]
MGLLVALAVLAWTTMSGAPIPHLPPWMPPWVSFRAVTVVVLGLFAFKVWIHRQREMLERSESERS